MKILLNNDDLNEALKSVSNLGFVPTMGSLHKGHISLIKHSKKACAKTIVSIFVNPNQFNNKRDYIRYPRNYKKDLSILRKLKVNFVFMPNKREIYNSKRIIKIAKKDKILCAKYRKGHFEGVIDVMERLTKICSKVKKSNKIKTFWGDAFKSIKDIEDSKYDKIFVDLNDDQYCIDLAKKNMRGLKRILKKGGVITAQVGSKDKKPKQVENWCKVLEKSFGNVNLSGAYIPSFDCKWNFASSIMR